MSDTELLDRLRTLAPYMEAPADPMRLLAPRIKRRRLAQRCGAVLLGLAVIGCGVFGAAAVRDRTAQNQTVTAAHGGTPPQHVGHRYTGPPLPQFAGTTMWVVADGRLGGKGAQWVFLSYLRDDTSCTWLAFVPSSPTAATTEPIWGDCEPGPGQAQPLGPSYGSLRDPSGGPSQVLLSGTVPTDVTTVHAEASTGHLLSDSVPTGASPVDSTHRFYVLDAGSRGFVGRLIYLNSAGRPVGHIHVDTHGVRLPANVIAKAAACESKSSLFVRRTGVVTCQALASRPWAQSPAAITAYSLGGAVAITLAILLRLRRRRQKWSARPLT
jgi:hypothetical protein